MSNTITYENTSIGQCITYANEEWAWVIGDAIACTVKNSSAIAYWSYNTSNNELRVQYKSSDTNYTYYGVPFSTLFALMTADSLGAFIAKEIKPNFSIA
jgi:hypothetical protein